MNTYKSSMTKTKPSTYSPSSYPPHKWFPSLRCPISEWPIYPTHFPSQISERCPRFYSPCLPVPIQVLKNLKLAILQSLFLLSTGTALMQGTILLSISLELMEWLIGCSVECPSLNHSVCPSRVIDLWLNKADTTSCLLISLHGFPLTLGRIPNLLERISLLFPPPKHAPVRINAAWPFQRTLVFITLGSLHVISLLPGNIRFPSRQC